MASVREAETALFVASGGNHSADDALSTSYRRLTAGAERQVYVCLEVPLLPGKDST